MASCLVNVADTTTVKVRAMNTYSEPMSIKQDSVLDSVQPYHDETPVLLKTEGENPDHFGQVRRIPLEAKRRSGIARMDSLCHLKESTGKTGGLTMPEHLQNLFKEPVKDKSAFEKGEIASLFSEYQKR